MTNWGLGVSWWVISAVTLCKPLHTTWLVLFGPEAHLKLTLFVFLDIAVEPAKLGGGAHGVADVADDHLNEAVDPGQRVRSQTQLQGLSQNVTQKIQRVPTTPRASSPEPTDSFPLLGLVRGTVEAWGFCAGIFRCGTFSAITHRSVSPLINFIKLICQYFGVLGFWGCTWQ